jgi:riboflavin synthase
MFTGIIQDIGTVTAIDKKGDWIVTVTTRLPMANKALGASVAHNGICLTLIDVKPSPAGQGFHYKVQLSQETVNCTTALHWREGTKINLETALRVGDELGGHYVSGHVDGIARLVGKTALGDSLKLDFDTPKKLARYIAAKGSVTLDGVSLTVNSVEDTRFSVAIIPHTQKETTLGAMEPGQGVNLEIDMLARYVERMRGAA